MIINYLKNIGFIFLGLVVTTLVLTVFNYFYILPSGILKILNIVVMFLGLFVGGFLTGRVANKKGYLEGIKFGGIMIVIILLLNLLVFKNKFNLLNILYYLLLLVTSSFGGIVGISKRKIWGK